MVAYVLVGQHSDYSSHYLAPLVGLALLQFVLFQN